VSVFHYNRPKIFNFIFLPSPSRAAFYYYAHMFPPSHYSLPFTDGCLLPFVGGCRVLPLNGHFRSRKGHSCWCRSRSCSRLLLLPSALPISLVDIGFSVWVSRKHSVGLVPCSVFVVVVSLLSFVIVFSLSFILFCFF